MELFLVFFTAIFVSLLNILHVLLGSLKTPPGHFYLWTGHYYPDYFLYLQGIAQAARGSWLVKNLFATDDFSQSFIGWGPDILLGKMAGLFRLSPILAYWLAVIISSFFFVILIFLIIRFLLADRPFYLQFSALLVYLFATPFYKIKISQAGREIVPYDFWYSPGYLFKHLGATWRHSFGKILALLIILVSAKVFNNISRFSLKKIFFTALGIGLLLIFLITFYPEIVPCILLAIFATGFLFAYRDYRQGKNNTLAYFVFLGTVFSLVLVGFLAINRFSASSGYVIRSSEWWIPLQTHPPLFLVLLATGPILVFSPFGLVGFFRQIFPLKMLIFFLTLASYLLFFSPIAPWLGTSNVRFLHPLITIFFAALAVLGMERLASFWPVFKKQLVIGATVLLLSIFTPANINFFQALSIDRNLFTRVTYIPGEFYEGFLFLNSDPDDRGVLTSPAGELGLILPVFAEKRVYLGRSILTPMFEEKKILVTRFYQGQMAPKEAREFLINNRLGFVVWSVWDGNLDSLAKYDFLRPIFKNNSVATFQYQEI